MTEVNVLKENFEKGKSINLPVELGAKEISMPVVHQVVKALLANKRQGTACTKTRGKVRGGGAKPFKQKGTGRARQGSTRSSLMVGGGTAFGPTPRSYDQKVNKKVASKAIQSVLADKLQAGKLTIVESFPQDGKTKTIYKELSERGLLPALVVSYEKNAPIIKAARNLKEGSSLPVDGFSVYEAVKFENLIIEEKALDSLIKRLV